MLAPNINSNSLSNHKGVTVNMIEIDEDWYVDSAMSSRKISHKI